MPVARTDWTIPDCHMLREQNDSRQSLAEVHIEVAGKMAGEGHKFISSAFTVEMGVHHSNGLCGSGGVHPRAVRKEAKRRSPLAN
jgi:hypothetical protein